MQFVVRFVVVSIIIFTPDVEYVTPVGLCTVEVAGDAPEPKFQDHITPTTVPVFVKSTGDPVHCGAVEVKFATGVALIVIVCVEVVTHPKLFVVINVTTICPDELYITPVGFSEVEVAGEAPEPKSHEKVVPAPVLPVLVKSMAVPTHCGAVEVNDDVGAGLMVITLVVVTEHPPGPVMVSCTVFAPGVV